MSKRLLHAAQRAAVSSLILAALVASAASAVWASELQATKDFADAAAAANRYIDKYGAEHVLLALDIDNTIMSMDTDLGSDHWFEWQSYLLTNEPNSPHLVAKTFQGLLDAQDFLYKRNHMHATQATEPELIAQLQKRGIATILLTSRGPEFRGPTERELKRCGYDFRPTALKVRNVPDGKYLAFDPNNPEKDGLTEVEVTKYKLTEARPVSYENGIFMTAGQHKGMMLLTMLNDAVPDIKAIVYVDDNVRHVGNVFSAAVARNKEVSVFHFQHEDVRVQRFQYSDKREVAEAWRKARGREQRVTAAKPPTNGSMPQIQCVPSKTWKSVTRRTRRFCPDCW
jgi:hypothetical protein